MKNLIIFENDLLKFNCGEELVLIDKNYKNYFNKEILNKNNKLSFVNNYIFNVNEEIHEVKSVDKLYEELLFELKDILNNFHNINWGIKAWRI